MRLPVSGSAVSVLAGIAVLCGPTKLHAQTDRMYFGAYTPAGKAISRPYPDCKRVTLANKVVWACPRHQQAGRDESRQNGSDRSAGNTGASEGLGTSGGMGTSSSGMGNSGPTGM